MTDSHSPRRFLGLELAGAKNQKTTLAALEYYPKEKKIFLIDIRDKIGPLSSESGDEHLLATIHELKGSTRTLKTKIGVNIPLTLPPCITCRKPSCPLPSRCTVASVKWMRDVLKKHSSLKARELTPYTQRPVEVWLKTSLMKWLPSRMTFEVDEALGGNKAPLTARLHFLKRHLGEFELIETSPKLAIATFSGKSGISQKIVSDYRSLESGTYARSEILDAVSESLGIFIYDRDANRMVQSLAAFDAFFCALTALWSDRGECSKPPRGFPMASGWIAYPDLERKGE